VKIIVPYAPGGTNDNVGRAYAEKLSLRLGQQFVIENRGGAGGAIGLEAGAKAPADGYTLIIGPFATLSVLPHARKVGYDPFSSFALIARVTEGIYGVAASPNVAATNLKEFIAYAKANPDKVTFASAGLGTATHLVGEVLNEAADIKMVHVPYRGSAEALTDLLSANVDLFIEGVVFPQAKAGKVKLLAVTSSKRHPDFPNVPTVSEIVPSFSYSTWTSFLAPAGTPQPIIDKLSAELTRAAGEKDLQDRLLQVGLVARTDTPADFAKGLKADSDRFGALVKKLNLRMD
jgi:tripartite-type tricarboxylate transporter receptor subunit TctC